MNYRVRSGIVNTKICNVRLLIPTRAASEYCPSILSLSFLSGMVWDMFEKGKSLEEIYNMYKILSKRDDLTRVNKVIDMFVEQGYLIVCQENEE